MNLALIREATEEDHARVEGALPLMSAGLTVNKYACILRRLRGMVAAWEHGVESEAPDWIVDAVRRRSRLTLLDDDLHSLLANATPEDGPELPTFAVEAEWAGALYVMEGSRLGGLYIAKHVEQTLHLREGYGNAYFRGYGARTTALWNELLQLMQQHVCDAETQDVIAGAKKMFRVFGDWMNGSAQVRTQQSVGQWQEG